MNLAAILGLFGRARGGTNPLYSKLSPAVCVVVVTNLHAVLRAGVGLGAREEIAIIIILAGAGAVDAHVVSGVVGYMRH